MKIVSIFIALCLLALAVGAAPTIKKFSDYAQTNSLQDSFIIPLEIPGQSPPYDYAILSTLKGYVGTNATTYTFNIYGSNVYSTYMYTTNITVYSNAYFYETNFVAYNFSTNLTVVNNSYLSNVYVTNLYSEFITNNYLYTTNVTANYITNNYLYTTNITAKNLTVQNIYAATNRVGDLIVTNGITNLSLTADTVLKADANQRISSIPNAAGVLNNDGAGNFTWAAAGGSQVWTNDSGTVRLVTPAMVDGSGLSNSPPYFLASETNNNQWIGLNAGFESDAVSSTFLGSEAGYQSRGSSQSQFIGYDAGYQSTNVLYSQFLGYLAGAYSTEANDCQFIGSYAGYQVAFNAPPPGAYSQFIGYRAGYQSGASIQATLIGAEAGYQATNSTYSQMIGYQAGYQAPSSKSVFIGNQAGYNAAWSDECIFLGSQSGYLQSNCWNSIFLGEMSGTNRANTLWIDTQAIAPDGSYQPLIYGEFDNRFFKINGTMQVTNTVTARGYIDTSGPSNSTSVAVSGPDGRVTWTNAPTFTGPASSLSTTTNGPANNELVTAGWVRGLFNVGAAYYASTNIDIGATNTAQPNQTVYTFEGAIPVSFVRGYATTDFLTNSGYLGSVVTTNSFPSLSGNIVVNAYLGFAGGGGGPSLTVHPEIYYSYDKTNWLGDYSGANQTIIHNATNLYQWAIDFPAYTATNANGFYIQRRFKVGTVTGTGTRTLYFLGGTNIYSGVNDASHITMQSPTATAGNAYLANNQTFTGTNNFSGQLNVNNITITNGFGRIRWTWAGPTNSILITTNKLYYTASGNCAITNWVGLTDQPDWYSSLTVTNSAATASTFTITAANTFSLDSTNQYTIPAAGLLDLAFENDGTSYVKVVGRTSTKLP